jgi:hypothetical protein
LEGRHLDVYPLGSLAIELKLGSQRMIPAFPEFNPLKFSDRTAVEMIVHTFAPDSDFSFSNLYSWNAQVSSLHGNLAVRLTDYLSSAPFLTFIGHHRLADSATQLLELSRAQCHSSFLRLVPEIIARELTDAGFAVTADDAATDYVYTVAHIADMHEWPGHSFRRRIRQFAALHPGYTVQLAPLHTIDTDAFCALFALWAKRKGHASAQTSDEYPAFKRFLKLIDPNIKTVGLYVDTQLVGFSSFELLPGGTATVHFSKADNAFHGGICNVLYWEEARLLQTLGVTHYNWGPDLGLQSLRRSKNKYKPCQLFKKFTVSVPHG